MSSINHWPPPPKNDRCLLMSKNIVIVTGAGISAESGLDTFRDQGGLWDKHPIEEVATWEAFEKNPKKVHRFYNKRRRELKKVQPNQAHVALASLEEKWPGDFALITQNVDDLHERAGSRNLFHMHGELKKARHIHTGEIQDCEDDLDPKGDLRPHVVWFGELPLYMDVIFDKLDAADIFVSIGTSGNVYPAGGFAQHVYMKGNCIRYEVNKEPSVISHLFDQRFVGNATEKVPELVELLLRDL